MDPIFGAIQQNLDSALSVPFVSSSVMLGLAFYAYKAAPELPSFIEELFNHVFFQIFVGFMVLYMGTRDFMLSLVVSVVFVYGMKMLSNVKEGMFGGGRCHLNSVRDWFSTHGGNDVHWSDVRGVYKYGGITKDELRNCVRAAGKEPKF